ncbi:MAG TPA: type I-C CRISPR-associated protein Cas5c [Anaeromyxobacter sp.]
MEKESRMLRLRAFGPLACFTRPEFKVERMSYEVMTPSAARGLLEAVLWKPAIRWRIHRIHVLRDIRFTSFKRNEVNGGRPAITAGQVAGEEPLRPFFVDEARAQRSTLALADVDYVVEATLRLTERAGEDDNVNKFTEMFERRLEKGQWFHAPYFGCREFAASIEPAAASFQPILVTKPLGLMLHDIDFGPTGHGTPHFFQAVLRDGVVEVPPFEPRARAEDTR